MGAILLVSHGHDAHGQEVLRRLRQQGADVHLFDTGRIPRETRLAIREGRGGWAASARHDGSTLDLGQVRAVWWRRPQPFTLDADIGGPDDRQFALAETHAAVAGLWALLDARWINDPDADDRASRKLLQLRVARECGLLTPETLATNCPDAARDFLVRAPGRVIYKSFQASERTWRETRVLKPEEEALLDSVRFAPVIFQHYVEAKADIRVTVVGDEAFAAAIHSQETAYPHDFRLDMDHARIEAIDMPGDVAGGLAALMQRLGLVYGAADFRLTPEGQWVFLEVNPAGQWLFIEERTRQPIAEALARKLMEMAGAEVSAGCGMPDRRAGHPAS